ncbi:MAG: response regulator [bacterium]
MKHKILTADDNGDLRKLINISLSADFDVLESANGAETLKAEEEGQPDLILLDMTLPDMSGLDVLKKLRAKNSKAVIIMLTASDDIELGKKSIEMGASEYVTKPFEISYLRTIIKDRMDVLNEKKPDSSRPWKVKNE